MGQVAPDGRWVPHGATSGTTYNNNKDVVFETI